MEVMKDEKKIAGLVAEYKQKCGDKKISVFYFNNFLINDDGIILCMRKDLFLVFIDCIGYAVCELDGKIHINNDLTLAKRTFYENRDSNAHIIKLKEDSLTNLRFVQKYLRAVIMNTKNEVTDVDLWMIKEI